MITAASKPPKAKSGSISPVPPPLQFASELNQTAATQNVKFSSSSSSTSSAQKSFQARKGVQVLPVLSQPVQLQEPGVAPPNARNQDHVDSNEADHFIEQLMKEAETDPKLRELTYGQSHQQQYQQHQSQQSQQYAQQYQPPQRPSRAPQRSEILNRLDSFLIRK